MEGFRSQLDPINALADLGRDWVPVFFKEYGVPNPDERKLAFYRLLDEFF